MNESIVLFLVDESIDLDMLKSKVQEFKNIKIISYDYYVDKSLNNFGLKHNKIEDYLDKNDQNVIDQKVIELSTNWYKHSSLQQFLEYENINLGSLIEIEYTKYFFHILKKFIGTLRVIKKERPSIIITSSILSKMLQTISKDTIKIISISTTKEKVPELFFDKIEIKFNLATKPITLQISRKNFLTIKRFVEKISSRIFNLKPIFNNPKGSILLLDFNPLVYGKLISEITNVDKQVVLLNQRRPAITNFKSLRIVKNSNCKVLLLDNFVDDVIISKIETEKKKIQIKLQEMWNLDVLNEIFVVENYSLWDSMRSSFPNTCVSRFIECVHKIELTKKLFDEMKFRYILEWAHTADERIVIIEANKRKIPIMTLQHGLMTLNQNFDKYRSIMPYSPSKGTKMAIWGEMMKNYNISHGINENQLLITGSPRHDVFFEKKYHNRSKNIILLAATSFLELNYAGNDTNSYVKFEEIIQTICKTTNKISDKKLIVKMHPAPLYFNVKRIIQTTDPSVVIYHDKDILDLLEHSAVVIALSYSSIILDAMILGIPTITIVSEEQGYEEEFPIKNNATLVVKNAYEFEKVLKVVLYDENVRNELIEKGREYVNLCLANQGKASKYLAKIISEY